MAAPCLRGSRLGLVTTRLSRAVRSRRFNFQQLSGHPLKDSGSAISDQGSAIITHMRQRQPETWGHSIVRTACPLDCPDSCTVDVTVEKGQVVKLDGGDENPVTRKFICAKVRR